MKMADLANNTFYSLLNEEDKESADKFIEFLYYRSEQEPTDETVEVVTAALKGEGLSEPVHSVKELMEALDA